MNIIETIRWNMLNVPDAELPEDPDPVMVWLANGLPCFATYDGRFWRPKWTGRDGWLAANPGPFGPGVVRAWAEMPQGPVDGPTGIHPEGELDEPDAGD